MQPRLVTKVVMVTLAVLIPSLLPAQGFGKLKKTITLERRLPAAVHITANSYSVKVTTRNTQYQDVAEKLQQTVETQLAKYNDRLTVDTQKPDMVISLSITNFNVPQPIAIRNSSTPITFGKNKNNAPRQSQTSVIYKITGTLTAAYQAKTRAGRFLDADNITAKYSGEFDQQGSKVAKGLDAIKKPWSKIRHMGKSEEADEDSTPRTTGDVEQLVMSKMTGLIAARIVNTDEKIEVRLARGELDSENKYAEAGQWTRMQEALETRTPFPKLTDDAYRLYNIGVTYEALGYQAESPAAAKKYLEQAAIQYGKAIDANRKEKFFLEPQDRIESALAHFKKLTSTGASTTVKKKSAHK